MGYFRELPNLEYQNFLSDAISSQSYLLVKNLFRRNKLRDDLQNVFTIFNKYEIVEGARPDTIAEEYYNNSEFDWVVLLTAGIINVRNEWPLSNKDLYNYAEEVYGTKLNNVHHYETIEVKDSSGRLIMPAGKIVDEDFTIPDPADSLSESEGTLSGSKIRKEISNYEYETIKNEKKSSIYLLKKTYLQQFLNDMRNIMRYKDSSQKINSSLIRTENTNVVAK
tara:strand:- start:381 stop:1049 length:669 start_codon:yes stop_codon:yes gene_type:complete